jgi:hypothetical protein
LLRPAKVAAASFAAAAAESILSTSCI